MHPKTRTPRKNNNCWCNTHSSTFSTLALGISLDIYCKMWSFWSSSTCKDIKPDLVAWNIFICKQRKQLRANVSDINILNNCKYGLNMHYCIHISCASCTIYKYKVQTAVLVFFYITGILKVCLPNQFLLSVLFKLSKVCMYML